MVRRLTQTSLLFLAALVLGPALLAAGDYPAPPPSDTYVLDEAGVISPADETRINELCREVEYITTAEMAVLVIGTTHGEPHWYYATEVGNEWGVGQARGDNGLVMLVAIDDRQVFTATGSGMEGILPDLVVDKIYRNILVPHFKKEQYGEGIYQALQMYAVEIERYYEVEFESTRGARKGREGWQKFWGTFSILLAPILIFAFFVVFILVIVFSKDRGSSGSSRSYWSSGSSSSSSVGSSSSSSSSSWSSSSSSGGGFSGGGFSGGGAGGGW